MAGKQRVTRDQFRDGGLHFLLFTHEEGMNVPGCNYREPYVQYVRVALMEKRAED